MVGADCSGGAETQFLLRSTQTYFIRVVGRSVASLHAMCGHDRTHVVPLHQELVLVPAALLVNVNDSSGYLRNTLYHHLWHRQQDKSEVGKSGEKVLSAIEHLLRDKKKFPLFLQPSSENVSFNTFIFFPMHLA